LAILCLISLFFCAAIPAFAAPPTCSSVPAVSQTSQLNLGTLQIPSTSATFTVNSSGATSGTGTLLYGTVSNGGFSISKGSSNQSHCSTITINVTGTSCGVSGCTLGSWTGKYGSTTLSGSPPWTGLALPGNGTNLLLGATATYNSTVRAGNYTPAFTISVNYDTETPTTSSGSGAIGFDLPLSIDTISDINFGHVQANTTGTYTINTSGNVTATGTGQWINGPTSAGNLLIHGSATQTISISAGSYVAGGTGGGVTLSNATCAYNGNAAVPCSLTTQAAPTATGKTLLLGVTVNISNQSQADNTTARPSFTITVTYL
jgi:hypothetical protein